MQPWRGDVMKKNKTLILLLIIEAVILILLLVPSFGKRDAIQISSDSGTLTDSSSAQENGEEQTLYSQDLSVKPGAYDVTVKYTSVSDPKDPDKKSYGDITGSVSFSLDRGGLRSNTLYLTDGTKRGCTRIWVTTWDRIDNLQMNIRYNGTGRLTVQDITLSENLMFRFTKIVSFLVLSLLVNSGYLFLSGRCFQKKKWVTAGLLFTISVSSALAVGNGFINGDDLTFHLHRIVSLSDSIRSGNIPQRIELTMLHGYGYASPLFYGEIFLFIPALLYLLCIPLQACYQVYVVLVNVATCLITYRCVKNITDDDMTAVSGSFLYTCCAYRLSNVYQRAAVGEYTAMTFLPLVVYGFYHLYGEKTDRDSYRLGDCLPLVLGLSGIIETHLLSVEMAALLIGIFILFHLRETFRLKRFLALVRTVVLTILINAWYLVPMLVSLRQNLKVENRDNYIAGTRQDIGRIFNLVFVNGLGQSQKTAGFTLFLGILLFLIIKFLCGKWKINRKIMSALDAAMGLGILSLFFVLSYCQWDNIYDISHRLGSLLSVVQFSWRYLAFASVLLVFGIVFSFMIVRENVPVLTYYKVVGGFVVCTSVFAATFVSAVTAQVVSGGQLSLHRYYMDNVQTDPTLGDPIGVNEYIYNGEYLPADMERSTLNVCNVEVSGNLKVTRYRADGNMRKMSVTNSSGSVETAVIPLVYYNNYHAYLENGSETDIEMSKDKRIRIVVPARYSGMITVRYVEPFSWRIAEAVTIITIISLCIIQVRGRAVWKRQHKDAE